MLFIYNFGIRLYYLAIIIAACFNKKAKLWLHGRKKIFFKLSNNLSGKDKIIWIHAASLGEFEQGRPIIETIKTKYSEYRILLTFFSPSGYEIRKNYEKADFVFYLPLDTKINAKKFIQIVQPEIAIFVKYEFWYHFLKQLNKKSIPCYLISAIFRNNQIFFRRYGKWFRKSLKLFKHIFVQNDVSAKILEQNLINHHSISGDTRFDRVHQIASESKHIELAQIFKGNSFTIIFGSTWPKDESLIINYINSTNTDIKYIIAPHEIHESHITQIEVKVEKKFIQFSKADNNSVNDYQVLIIDNIGMLSSLYKYADLAYIGGGFGVGIHNILEAATYGVPVIYGPNYYKFQEAVDLIKEGGAFSIKNYNELEVILNKIYHNKDFREKCSTISKQYIENGLGATDIIIDYIFNSFNPNG